MKEEKESKTCLEHTLTELASREEIEPSKEHSIAEKLMNLQKKYVVMLEQEKQKVHKETERAYEQRIASLENKLSELSTTLARYNKSRQEDQNEILKLREQIIELSTITSASSGILVDSAIQTNSDHFTNKHQSDTNTSMKVTTQELEHYSNTFTNQSKILEKSISLEDYASINTLETDQDLKEKRSTRESKNEIKNLQVKIQMFMDQNSALNDQLSETITNYEKQMEELKKQHCMFAARYEQNLQDLHVSYKAHISELEVQIQKQRERTLALLEEKEQEVTNLKSTFHSLIHGKKSPALLSDSYDESTIVSHLDQIQENPHILHYAHELARRDVLVTSLRKNCGQLENSLRDLQKELIMLKHSHEERIKNLSDQIYILERCQSREGANLEYLKNVFVNYLQSKDAGSKKHMLNAIAVILKLNDAETDKIKNML